MYCFDRNMVNSLSL
nr:unnamed protein product [Callosobruchus analis]